MSNTVLQVFAVIALVAAGTVLLSLAFVLLAWHTFERAIVVHLARRAQAVARIDLGDVDELRAGLVDVKAQAVEHVHALGEIRRALEHVHREQLAGLGPDDTDPRGVQVTR
jgi:hypothetical protein